MAGSPAQAHSLGSYEVIRKLDSGGMAEVFLAAQHMPGDVRRLVVIKAMLPHLADDDQFVQMFMREARIAAVLSHPNVVQIYDVSVIDGRPCIVMEFLRGRDLWHVLRRTARRGEHIGPRAAAAIVAQAATGLHYAHHKRDDRGRRLDLVHRDISPHNLFLTRDGNVRVLDFGIAKSRYQQQRTQQGVLKGKLPYMAPEQARGLEVDPRTDEFALGVILWECLTGRRLFSREDPFQTMNSLFHMEVPPPSRVEPTAPPELDAPCLRALERDASRRFDDCEQLGDALREWLRESSGAREASLVAEVLERAVPAGEDRGFYGFDPDSTATTVTLPEARDGARLDEAPVAPRDGTPSQSGIARSPDPPSIADAPTALGIGAGAPTVADGVSPAETTQTLRPAPRRRLLPLLALGGALLLAAAGGVVAALAAGGEDEPGPRSASPGPETPPGSSAEAPADPAPPQEVEVRFDNVPEGVSLEVDGTPLEGDVLRTVASDEVRHVRALRDGREVWRYDGLFQRSTTVAVPDLAEAAEPVDEPAATGRRPVRRTRRARRRAASMSSMPSMSSPMHLGNDLDLGYP